MLQGGEAFGYSDKRFLQVEARNENKVNRGTRIRTRDLINQSQDKTNIFGSDGEKVMSRT